jgi:hypothetical protein
MDHETPDRRLSSMMRPCDDRDFELIWAIINDGAQAYKGIIPADRWTEPYMSREELRRQIDQGVVFWGYEETGTLEAVMGIQQVQDVRPTELRQFSAILAVTQHDFSATQTVWRRERNSNPRYGF